MDNNEQTLIYAKHAKEAALLLSRSTPEQRIETLKAFHRVLTKNKQAILDANQLDLNAAKDQVEKGTLSQQLLSRLSLQTKLDHLIASILDVTRLPCPTNIITRSTLLAKDLTLKRITCPLGVILIIFESRPECIVQIACLTLFSGNAVILKGGKEAMHSNKILVECLHEAIKELKLDLVTENVIQLVGRESIDGLLKMERYVDMVIPRGSKSLVEYCQSNTRIPVLGHSDGICTIYVDESADPKKAVDCIVDSKTDYPTACNTVETLLVHASHSHTLLPLISNALSEKKVIMKCCPASYAILNSDIKCELSTDEDYQTEFMDLTIAIKIVDNITDAIQHINTHGSHHTDCIITESPSNAELFMASVDSAGVYHNASTRFADGFRYGFGAEIGVSTNKTHARGPVGLEGLVIFKYHLFGDGHCVGQFTEKECRKYLHSKLPLE